VRQKIPGNLFHIGRGFWRPRNFIALTELWNIYQIVYIKSYLFIINGTTVDGNELFAAIFKIKLFMTILFLNNGPISISIACTWKLNILWSTGDIRSFKIICIRWICTLRIWAGNAGDVVWNNMNKLYIQYKDTSKLLRIVISIVNLFMVPIKIF